MIRETTRRTDTPLEWLHLAALSELAANTQRRMRPVSDAQLEDGHFRFGSHHAPFLNLGES